MSDDASPVPVPVPVAVPVPPPVATPAPASAASTIVVEAVVVEAIVVEAIIVEAVVVVAVVQRRSPQRYGHDGLVVPIAVVVGQEAQDSTLAVPLHHGLILGNGHQLTQCRLRSERSKG